MILDLIVILLVVVISFLFCMNNENNNNQKNNKNNYQYCSLSHIVVGLTVIVFYKLVKYYRVKQQLQNTNTNTNNTHENFSVSKSINDFISSNTDLIVNQDTTQFTSEQLKAYTKQISDLTNQIKKLNENVTQDDNPTIQSNLNVDSISLDSQQAYQQFQIDYLSKQIKNAQDIINASAISNTSQNYKPIKIYSSCVANANGTLSTDQPISNNVNGLQPLQSVINSSAGQQIKNTASQANLDLPSLINKILKP
jgi:hypothetical protein